MGAYGEEARLVCVLTPMNRSLLDFARAVRVTIEEEQHKPLPDTSVIALLCDALRLGAEYLATRVEPNPSDDVIRQIVQACIDSISRDGCASPCHVDDAANIRKTERRLLATKVRG